MKYVVSILISFGLLQSNSSQAAAPTQSGALYDCQSQDLQYMGHFSLSLASRNSESSMEVCDGGYYGEPTNNCHEVVNYYEEKDLTLQIFTKGNLMIETQFSVRRYKDMSPTGSFTGGNQFMNAGLGYEVYLLEPERPGQPYKVFTRIFRGKPFETPQIARIEMTCVLAR